MPDRELRGRLVIFGFGGHARSVADVALSCGYADLIFIDANAREGEAFLGYEVVRNVDGIGAGWEAAFAASGDGRIRAEQCTFVRERGFSLVSLVSPMATVGAGSLIEAGCFIGHHAHVGPLSTIEMAAIINTGAVVEHESAIGRFAHVSVNATIAGRASLGDFSMLGAGATIIDGVNVGSGVTIGAGAVVRAGIRVAGTYVGVPARRLK